MAGKHSLIDAAEGTIDTLTCQRSAPDSIGDCEISS
jgi:hypothetical protein